MNARRWGWSVPEDVLEGTVVRAEMAYPIYDHEYQHHVRLIRDYLSQFTNLQTIGRNGLHRYNNMDHSMLTGLYAAPAMSWGKESGVTSGR